MQMKDERYVMIEVLPHFVEHYPIKLIIAKKRAVAVHSEVITVCNYVTFDKRHVVVTKVEK